MKKGGDPVFRVVALTQEEAGQLTIFFQVQ
jgi:hypothetical protein